MYLVLDATIVTDLIAKLGVEGYELRHRLDEISTASTRSIIETLTWVEVSSSLRNLARKGRVDSGWAEHNITHFPGFPANRIHLTAPMMRRAWEMRHNVTVYDGAYLAATENLEAITDGEVALVTGDTRLARSPAVRCQVMLYPNDFD